MDALDLGCRGQLRAGPIAAEPSPSASVVTGSVPGLSAIVGIFRERRASVSPPPPTPIARSAPFFRVTLRGRERDVRRTEPDLAR